MKLFLNLSIRLAFFSVGVTFLMSFSGIGNYASAFSPGLPGVKDTINPDSLIFPFDDYSNSPSIFSYNSPLFLKNPSAIKSTVKYDPKTGKFVFYDKIGDFNYRNPYYMSFGEYIKYSNKKNTHEYWMERSALENAKGETSMVDRLVSQNLIVPIQGFDKIFGSNTINIKPAGTAELIFGLKITEIENPALPKDLQKMVNFDFDMNIKMGVNGQIGDKMKLGINFDTDATFEFENNVKIGYQGKEDEIIQKIEAGNVTMPLSGSLITGSHNLFGLKTELKFGNLLVTSVFSQQKGESKTIEVAGGATTTPFEITADNYDADKHFFIAQYFRDRYDIALSDLPIIKSNINIKKIEVWITNRSGKFENSRNIVAFMDLGENEEHFYATDSRFGTTSETLPTNETNNLYSLITTDFVSIRNISNVTNTLSVLENFNSGIDYEKIQNARLLSPSEYSFNSSLGYISLNSQLNNDEVLAVAFEYENTTNGEIYRVGEFSSDGPAAPDALFLKLLKPTTLSTEYPTWDLMMKNVYSFNAYQVNSQDFKMEVMYRNDKTGSSVNYIPAGNIDGQVLLRVLGLDNLNKNNEPGIDGFFDFIDKVTINASNGKIYFPVTEPFGSYLKSKIIEGNENDPEINRIAEQYIFQELYDETQSTARQKAEKNKFFLKGEYRSAGGSEINLNAMNIPEGSVTVTAGAEVLTENVDYTVDYNLGRVTILKQSLLESGTPISISLESNSMFAVGTKSMIGTHLDYRISDNFNIGATIMHLHQKPLTNKVSIGNEPISNTIWGTNINLNQEVPFLTKLVDKVIPFIKTKAPSNIDFSGEFAHLIPGHPKVLGEEGFAHIDDFEGSKVTFDLKSPSRWRIASTPQGQPDLFPEADSSNTLSYGYNRAKLAWYNINRDLITEEYLNNHLVRQIPEQEIFPDRDYEYDIPQFLYVLNLAYYPNEKGPYNYDVEGLSGISAGMDDNGKLNLPETRWAGIAQSLTTNDFEEANIEFVEFWMLDPFIYNQNHTGGDIYFNFGNISEDILRDSRQAFENGLPSSGNGINIDSTSWGRVPILPRITSDFANEPADARQYQDVGLDGLSDEDEKTFFDDYINRIENKYSGNPLVLEKVKGDPSNDNYLFYNDPVYDTENADVLTRYKNYNNQEHNSTTTGNTGINASPILTPDMEDLNNDYTLSENESYFQYKIHLNPNQMNVGQNYITDIKETEVDPDGDNIKETVKWYHFKMPLEDYQKTVGSIQDFKSIRFVRLFLKDWDEEIVLRFAEMDLVRGDWRKYRLSMLEGTEGSGTPELTDAQIDINAVNIEENASREPVNYVLPPGVTREISPGNAYLTQLNEQAISLRVLNLSDGDARAAYKNVSLDVRQFKRLQMFIHAEAIEGNILNDDDLCAFIRLGSDYKENYYEYEIPLKLTEPGYYSTVKDKNEPDRELVWRPENMLDIDFEVFQKVKQERNQKNSRNLIELTSEYSIYDTENYGDETGRRISITGSPNLSNVRTIMIGIRNRKKDNNKLSDDGLQKSIEVWMNELRLAGFDEAGGWATRGRLQANLADFSSIAVSGDYSTPGFGSIEKRVSERQRSTDKSYDFSTSTELGKFFPKKYGVRVPVYFGYSEVFSDPEYDPLNPDIKMTTALKGLSQEDRTKHLQITQDYLKRKSFNITNIRINGNSEKKKKEKKDSNPKLIGKREGKNKGNSKPLWHISNWTASYGLNETFIRNINTDHNILKVHTGAIAYNYNISPKNIKPFSKVKLFKYKAFKIIKDFNFYYMPSMIAFRSDMRKSYNEIQLRNIEAVKSGSYGDTLITTFDKQFIWNRTYDFRYNLTRDFKITYRANNQAWVDEPDGRIDKDDEYKWNAYKDSVVGNIKDWGRTRDFHQNFNVIWSLPINKLPLLAWTTANARYDADYYWTKGLESKEIKAEDIGNTISNNQSVQLTSQLNFERLYRKVKYLKNIDNKFKGKSKKKKKKYKTVTFSKTGLKLKKDRAKTITHNLKTDNVKLTVTDKNKKPIKGKTEIIDANKVKFIPEVDAKGVTVEISGKKEIKDNIFRIITDYTVYSLMSVRNLSLNYTENNGMIVPGYLPKSKFLGMDESFNAPGWKFITGLTNTEGLLGFAGTNFMQEAVLHNWLSGDSSLNAPTVTTHDVTYTFRATLKPLQGMRVDVTADRRTNNQKKQYWINFDGNIDPTGLTETGNFSMSFISLKTAFKQNKLDTTYNSDVYDLFKSYRIFVAENLAEDRASKISGYNPNIPNTYIDSSGVEQIRDNYPHGYSEASQDVLLPAFLAAYSGQTLNGFINNPFPNIPLPNWRIKYDGLTYYDAIKKVFKRITINHAYNSKYQITAYNLHSDYNEYLETGLTDFRDELTNDFISEYQMGGVSIDEKFVPLIGIDMRWKNEMQSKLEYKQTRMLMLSFANNQILEMLNKEYVIGFGYKVPKLKIPMTVQGQQKIFESDLNIRVDFTYRDMITIIRRINEEINDVSAGNKNISIKVNADYNLDKVTLRIFYERLMNEPRVSSGYKTTNTHIGFSLRFNLANI
ncbi:MAG: cell surface protein SprA [Bacteroidales bacterium]|nr:cell surface protein SprA [Bacteroidales bacterium]